MVTATLRKETTALKITVLERRVNYEDSKNVATKHSGRLLTPQELVFALKEDKSLYEKTNGKWFWLDNESSPKLSTFSKMNPINGQIDKVSEDEWNRLPAKQRAYFYDGNSVLSVSVNPHGYTNRLGFYGYYRREAIAPIVVFAERAETKTEKHPIKSILRRFADSLDEVLTQQP